MLITEIYKIESKEIELQTREGVDIANNQSFFISLSEKNEFLDYEKKYGDVTIKGKPSPIYNCHGLTFASRRTGIFETEELWKIIKDDKYKEINIFDTLPGDVVLYITKEGDIWHSGIVVSEPDKDLKIPRIWSKWGRYCEIIHYTSNSPYNKFAPTLKFFRLIDDDY